MSLNCVFPFVNALLHGLYIGKHFFQIVALIFSGAFEIIVIFKFQRHFNYKVDLVLLILYKIGFLCFNVNIFLWSFYNHLNIPFTFAFTIIILVLLVFTALKIFFSVGIIVYEKCKGSSKSKKKAETIVMEVCQKKTLKALKASKFKITCKTIEGASTKSVRFHP